MVYGPRDKGVFVLIQAVARNLMPILQGSSQTGHKYYSIIHVRDLLARRTFPLNLDQLKEILPDYWVCSNDKAKEMPGFVPEFDLAGGMSNAIEWYQRQHWL